MYSTVPAALLAAFLSTVAVRPAGAADVSAAQADTLQLRMQSWLSGVLGPDSSPTSPAVQVRPEGDHYRIELPLGTPRAGEPSPVTLFTSARPIEDGRWLFESPAIPSPTHFTLGMPALAKNGKAPGPNIPVEITIETKGGRTSRGIFDPSFATPSTLSSSSRDGQIRAQSALFDQLTKVERSSSTSTLRPSGANRVDFMDEVTFEGYTLTSRSQDAPPLDLSAQQIRITGGIIDLSRDRAATMIPAVARVASSFVAELSSPGSIPAAGPSVDPQLLRTILQSLKDLASEFTLNETFDGVAYRSETSNGAVNQLRIGMGAKSESGLLQASMDLGFDGLVLSDPALGAMAGLLPTKVALRPVLTGVSTDQALRWLDAMGDAMGDARKGTRPPDFATLSQRADVSAGLESFAVDVGGASFSGNGKLTTVSGGGLAGQAQITASNFDDLIARVNAVPELAGVLPAFIFAKGISQTVEGRLVWNLAYRDAKLLVNGTDLSAMTGHPPVKGNPGPKNR
jgi:hypothetical protein